MNDTAAQHLSSRVPTARADERVSAVIARLCAQTYDVADAVYVVDDVGKLQGLLPFTRLLAAGGEGRVVEHMLTGIAHVEPDTDQERTAMVALRSRMASVPVLDSRGVLLGVVPAVALLDILHSEHVEDLHRLAGIARENDLARESIEAPPTRRARHRLPWLLVGFAGSMLAAYVMSQFEHLLASKLAVSFFVPTIVYLADAIGTQTEAIAVRGLSLSHQPFPRLLRSELGTGACIGAVLGVLALLVVGLCFGDFRLGVSVGLAVLGAGTAATTIGLALPWLLARSGADPALGSGPLATVIQDLLSLLIYFGITAALLPQ